MRPKTTTISTTTAAAIHGTPRPTGGAVGGGDGGKADISFFGLRAPTRFLIQDGRQGAQRPAARGQAASCALALACPSSPSAPWSRGAMEQGKAPLARSSRHLACAATPPGPTPSHVTYTTAPQRPADPAAAGLQLVACGRAVPHASRPSTTRIATPQAVTEAPSADASAHGW